ncbi:LOW QUALITY PROTEIN: acyl-CoA-binding domain-containing protein 5-like [Scyliorhinus canicula]|uniref:LOW QUALITY PROTEIN: acyl-CoA-binding domain-containing protein 5-like n=1 Tax=Scyliorhinus canicula TaxID=7830 RepID=UPI0018F58FD6|nr:LOW QUALITY PROTEIN: acyl-CoA-binding domain-containing protein 5-like [Scyliorhinus canicula]
MVEVDSDCQRQFQAAVSVIQTLPKNGSYRPSHAKMLKFYSYYKQATIGPCSISRPGFWDPIGRIKWDAWKALGNLSKKEAMMTYVEEIKQTAQEFIDTMPGSEGAEQHFHLFEPLYEVVKDMPKKVPGENVETPLTLTPHIAGNGMLKNHESNMTSEEQNDQEQDVVTNRKAVRFNENGINQDGDSNGETYQANGIYPQDGDFDPELGVSRLDTTVETVRSRLPQEHPSQLHDTTGKAVRFNGNEISQDGDSNSETYQADGIYPEGGDFDPELGVTLLDATKEIVRSRLPQEHPSQLHDTTESSNSYTVTVEVADQNHFTSDSESELFCDSVEELDQDKISAVQSSRSVGQCSLDLFSLQDTEPTALFCSVDGSTGRPNVYRSACGDLPQNQVTQARAANGGGGMALDGGCCEKRKTTFTSPLSGSEWLTEGKGTCPGHHTGGLHVHITVLQTLRATLTAFITILQDTEPTALFCSVDGSMGVYQSACGDLAQNQVTQARAANGGGGTALDGGCCEKRKTTFTSPLSGSEWLTEGKAGRQQDQGGNSWGRGNHPSSDTETSERSGYRGESAINLNDKIARVLHHLQENMQSVLQRISRLEDVKTSQVQTVGVEPPCLKTSGHERTSRWRLGPSGRTLLFLVVWPFIAQWIVYVVLRRKRS